MDISSSSLDKPGWFKMRKAKLITAFAVMMVLVLVLALALGLGLRHKNSDDGDCTSDECCNLCGGFVSGGEALYCYTCSVPCSQLDTCQSASQFNG